MRYYVWYDIWTTAEEQRETGKATLPTVWHTFESADEARQHIMRLSKRAFRDGRTIAITISPKDH